MVKLIYSSAFDSAVDVAMRIIQDPAVLTKSASTIFGRDYSQLAPDKDHVGIHLTALGAFERYGSNRDASSHRVIGQADFAAKGLAQMGQRPQVAACWRRGIRAGAFEQDEIAAASGAGQ